ncbi:hypothetical protein [uncultured Candidatus Kuenenia sp.]|uniref:hypothetical protein n=1 Tax=uncultured Candidatus Kuenenia sp. TaxID=1048336 RepID=UPI0002FA277F|nr:hypothetical protein [uncultured Candidatus Kuenenia sp.]
MSPGVICEDCKETREESIISLNVSPCPNCGSKKIVVHVKIQEKVKPREKHKVKTMEKDGNRSKLAFEVVKGDDLHKKSGKWYNKERIIDKKNYRYKETVRDPETGKIIHHCEEPLNKHIGHGSAKVKILKEKCDRKQKASEGKST